MEEKQYIKDIKRNDQLTEMLTNGTITTTEYSQMAKRPFLDNSPLVATLISYVPFINN